MRDHVALFINGRAVRVDARDARMPLADFLRRERGLTGTKVVCAEGDCGSCAVLVGRLVESQAGMNIQYRAVTSCILQMVSLDGTHVVTVEGLSGSGRDNSNQDASHVELTTRETSTEGTSVAAPPAADLNPIQASMVACHGAQCGFCTPGFVVALQPLLEMEGASEPSGSSTASVGNTAVDSLESAEAERLRRGLTGNLCRCTGYDAILRAALATDRSALLSVDDRYPPESLISELRVATAEPMLLSAASGTLYKPVTVAQAVAHLSASIARDSTGSGKPETVTLDILAGGTDLGVVQNKGRFELNQGMTTSGLNELRYVKVIDAEPNTESAAESESKAASGRAIEVGATATLTDLEDVAAIHLPAFAEYLGWFGSPLIRAGGTLAGNLCTASPIGDTAPVLYALDATLELTGPEGARWLSVEEFHTGYRTTQRRANELVTRIRIPLPAAGEHLKLYKVCRRLDMDISSFSAAAWLQVIDGVVQDVRLSMGGVGPRVLRVTEAEAILRGARMDEATFAAAGEAAANQVTPMSDVRGSAEYRSTLARNILTRVFHDLTDAAGPDTKLPSDSGAR